MIRLVKIIFFFLPLLAVSQPVTELYDTSRIFTIGKSMGIYEDKTAALTIREIASPAFLSKFELSKVDVPNYNLTRSKIWCRFQLLNRSDANDWYLEAGNGGISHIEVYSPTQNGNFTKAVGGFSVWAGTRDFFSNRPVFHLNLPVDSVYTFYVAIADKLPLQAHLNIGNIRSFIYQNHKYDFLNGVFYGLLLMLAIYNLFIFFSVRDRVFIYYILYIIGNALFISFANGYGSHLPYFFTSTMVAHPTWVPFLLGTTACLFMLNFLNVKKNYPLGYRICLGMVSFFTIVPPLDMLGFTHFGITVVQMLGLILSVYSVVIGIVVLRKGYRPARFYLLGFGFYLVGLFVYIASDLQIIPFNVYSHNSLQIGTAFEAVLLSLAVSDKISNFKKDKELAQEEALHSARENEKLIREQNIILEQKVTARTLELQLQKELVEEKNKDIMDSIRYAKRIQQAILPSETYIKRILSKLKGGDE